MNTAEQENIFTKTFYRLWDESGFGESDDVSPYPWGCPWLAGIFKIKEDAAEHAEAFFDLVKNEIAHLIEEEDSYDQ